MSKNEAIKHDNFCVLCVYDVQNILEYAKGTTSSFHYYDTFFFFLDNKIFRRDDAYSMYMTPRMLRIAVVNSSSVAVGCSKMASRA